MNYVKLIAPAKINLVLAVGEKLPDGYHEAHTILQALALHDTLEIRSFPAEPGAGLSITLKCESSNMIDQLTIDQEDNIVYKAATELARALDRAVDEEIHIYLAKQIPFEAGLGGGSSDAAATLKGLSALWGVDPLDPAVIEVAAKLGADVPFSSMAAAPTLMAKATILCMHSNRARVSWHSSVLKAAAFHRRKPMSASTKHQNTLPPDSSRKLLVACKRARLPLGTTSPPHRFA